MPSEIQGDDSTTAKIQAFLFQLRDDVLRSYNGSLSSLPKQAGCRINTGLCCKAHVPEATVLLEIIKLQVLKDKQHCLSLPAQHFCHHPSATAEGKKKQSSIATQLLEIISATFFAVCSHHRSSCPACTTSTKEQWANLGALFPMRASPHMNYYLNYQPNQHTHSNPLCG